MDTKLKELLEQYEIAKVAIKLNKDIVEDLQPHILELFPQDKEVSAARGKFVMKTKTSWEYSKELTKRHKEEQAMELANGIAKENTISYLEYRQNS